MVGSAMVQTVDRSNDKRTEQREARLRIYQQVVDTFEGRTQWPSGENVTVKSGKMAGRNSEFFLRNQNRIVCLMFFREGTERDPLNTRFQSESLPVGILGKDGWETYREFDEFEFLRWCDKVQAGIDKQR
jgi:hypothetical protein